MKKRLLITSIVMMLVCAVALSTATYAWFTSNTTVSASTMTLKAATSDKSALGIGWTGEKAGTYIVSNINAILDPMAPEIHNASGQVVPLADNETIYDLASGNQKFYTSNIKQEESVIRFSNEKLERNPVVYTEDSADATGNVTTGNSFYIVNMSTANVLDSVVVSGVFTDYEGNERYIMVDTSVAPTQGVDYYLKNGDNYELIEDDEDANPAKTDRTDLQTHGFDNEKTYYIRQSLYVETSDTVVKEDTQYYTRSGSEGNYTYAPADVAVGSSATGLFEKRNQNGDDMLRIAIFTKEYRYTADDADDKAANPTKKYYWINPSTGKLAVYDFTGLTDPSPVALKLLEVTNNDQHKLRGVIGKNATQFKAATAPFDINTVYYTKGGKVQIDVSAGTFDDLKNWNNDDYQCLFTSSDGTNFTPVTSTDVFDNKKTYYKQAYELVNQPSSAGLGNYYTASNTVVNGDIAINKEVSKMNYYTNVTKSIDLWDVYDQASAAEDKCVTLKPGELIDIIAVIWLDGTDLDDTRSDEYAQVSLKFDAVRNTHSSQNAQH